MASIGVAEEINTPLDRKRYHDIKVNQCRPSQKPAALSYTASTKKLGGIRAQEVPTMQHYNIELSHIHIDPF